MFPAGQHLRVLVRRVVKCGNSVAIRLPKEYKEGMLVKVVIEVMKDDDS